MPKDMIKIEQKSEDQSEDEDGPFIKLPLNDVIKIIQSRSAHNSQNIKNVKYFAEEGVWKDFPTKIFISRKTIEARGKKASLPMSNYNFQINFNGH